MKGIVTGITWQGSYDHPSKQSLVGVELTLYAEGLAEQLLMYLLETDPKGVKISLPHTSQWVYKERKNK